MNIALIGPGAMGMLFGSYLSRQNHVLMVGRDVHAMDTVARQGIMVQEQDGTETVFHPDATADSTGSDPVDLVILFVKVSASKAALDSNRHLIGPDTVLLTLQNGAGHDTLLKEYAAGDRILIGVTQEGSYRADTAAVCHTGRGITTIGAIQGKSQRFSLIADTFNACGLECRLTDEIKKTVWNKLMINASSSVISGVLQVKHEFIRRNKDAWDLVQRLVREMCSVAEAEGYSFDPEYQIRRVEQLLLDSPEGWPSISADLKAGRITEATVITGSVVAAAHRTGVPAPTHEAILSLVHAMEARCPSDAK